MKKTLTTIIAAALAGCISTGIKQETLQEGFDKVVRHNTVAVKNDGKVLDKLKGIGIVYKDKLITLDHVTSNYSGGIYWTPMGSRALPLDREDLTFEGTYLDSTRLEPIIESERMDLAVFQIPEHLCPKYCDFNLKLDTDYSIGKQIFMVGTPQGFGKKVRTGYIAGNEYQGKDERLSDLEQTQFGGSIFTDIVTIHGDSGGAVFNKDGDLMGIVQGSIGGIGVFKPITKYLEWLD